jgi:hypothetical protein
VEDPELTLPGLASDPPVYGDSEANGNDEVEVAILLWRIQQRGEGIEVEGCRSEHTMTLLVLMCDAVANGWWN